MKVVCRRRVHRKIRSGIHVIAQFNWQTSARGVGWKIVVAHKHLLNLWETLLKLTVHQVWFHKRHKKHCPQRVPPSARTSSSSQGLVAICTDSLLDFRGKTHLAMSQHLHAWDRCCPIMVKVNFVLKITVCSEGWFFVLKPATHA